MNVGHGVAIAVLAGRELAEVAGGDGADGVEEVEDDAARGHAVDLDVKLHDTARGGISEQAVKKDEGGLAKTSGPDGARTLAWEAIT